MRGHKAITLMLNDDDDDDDDDNDDDDGRLQNIHTSSFPICH